MTSVEEWVGNEETGKEHDVPQKIVWEKGLPYIEHLDCPERQWARAKRVLKRRDLPRYKLSRLADEHSNYKNQKSGQHV